MLILLHALSPQLRQISDSPRRPLGPLRPLPPLRQPRLPPPPALGGQLRSLGAGLRRRPERPPRGPHHHLVRMRCAVPARRAARGVELPRNVEDPTLPQPPLLDHACV